jgi:hypothetical protein
VHLCRSFVFSVSPLPVGVRFGLDLYALASLPVLRISFQVLLPLSVAEWGAVLRLGREAKGKQPGQGRGLLTTRLTFRFLPQLRWPAASSPPPPCCLSFCPPVRSSLSTCTMAEVSQHRDRGGLEAAALRCAALR